MPNRKRAVENVADYRKKGLEGAKVFTIAPW